MGNISNLLSKYGNFRVFSYGNLGPFCQIKNKNKILCIISTSTLFVRDVNILNELHLESPLQTSKYRIDSLYFEVEQASSSGEAVEMEVKTTLLEEMKGGSIMKMA